MAPPLAITVTLPVTDAPGGNMDPPFLPPPFFATPPFALGVCLMPRLRSTSMPLAPPCLADDAPRRPAAPP